MNNFKMVTSQIAELDNKLINMTRKIIGFCNLETASPFGRKAHVYTDHDYSYLKPINMSLTINVRDAMNSDEFLGMLEKVFKSAFRDNEDFINHAYYWAELNVNNSDHVMSILEMTDKELEVFLKLN